MNTCGCSSSSRCCSRRPAEQRLLHRQRLAVGHRPNQRTRSGDVHRADPARRHGGTCRNRFSDAHSSVDQSFGLEDLLDPDEEAGGVGAVERAVVPRHRQVADRVDDDRLGAVGQRGDDRLADDGVGRQDRHLRLVDDRERQHRAGRAVVGDRERAAGDLVGHQLLRPGPAGEVVDLPGDGAEPLALGAADRPARSSPRSRGRRRCRGRRSRGR